MGVLCLFHPEAESPRVGWLIVFAKYLISNLKCLKLGGWVWFFTVELIQVAPVQADVDKAGHPIANPKCLFAGVDNIVYWDFHWRSEIESPLTLVDC